jgi:tetratricopeptide (TPR) repeat protein
MAPVWKKVNLPETPGGASDGARLTANEWYQDGQRLKANGRNADAVAAFSRAIECNRLFAEAYFSRGACHYALRHYQLAREDFDAAALFGCRVAQLWSRFEVKLPEDPDEADDPRP